MNPLHFLFPVSKVSGSELAFVINNNIFPNSATSYLKVVSALHVIFMNIKFPMKYCRQQASRPYNMRDR